MNTREDIMHRLRRRHPDASPETMRELMEAANEIEELRTSLQAMHRRAQKAESDLFRLCGDDRDATVLRQQESIRALRANLDRTWSMCRKLCKRIDFMERENERLSRKDNL